MARKTSTRLPEYVTAATAAPTEADLLGELGFEHRQIERLWSQLQLSHRRHVDAEHRPGARMGPAGQHQLARQIVTALAEHEVREVQLLYPLVERVVGAELAEHARADHEVIRELLDQVDGEDPADEQVFDALTSVMANVLAHIEEEERVAFPMLRALLPSEELAVPTGAPALSAPVDSHPGVTDIAAAERGAASPEPARRNPLSRARSVLKRR